MGTRKLTYHIIPFCYEDYFLSCPVHIILPKRYKACNYYYSGYQGSGGGVKGEGNSYTTYFRQLDVRINRWRLNECWCWSSCWWKSN